MQLGTDSAAGNASSIPLWAVYTAAWGSACGLVVWAMLSTGTLLAIDETRYAGVAWDMLRQQHWLVPHSNGTPYPDKPPLLFWLWAGGWQVLGPSVVWGRLVPALFAFAALALTGGLARCLWLDSARSALLAPTILIGFALWALWLPLLMFDVALSFWVLTAISGVALAGFRNRGSGWLLFAFGTGLGILTKGPVAVLHALPVALLAPVWSPRQPFHWASWYTRLTLSLLGSIAIALAWALPAARAGGEQYAQAILWGQSAGRVTASFAHERGVFWYLPRLAIVLFPWLLWAPAWQAAAKLRPRHDHGIRFLVAWLVPVFLAFCIISGKQIYYLLPLLPCAALLLARGLTMAAPRAPPMTALPVAGSIAAVATLLFALPTLQPKLGWPSWTGQFPTLLPWAVAGLALLPLLPSGGPERRAGLIAATTVGTVAALLVGGLGTAAPRYDLRPAGRIVARAQAQGRSVAVLGDYHNGLQFTGRLARPVATLDTIAQGRRWAAAQPDGVMVIDYENVPACLPESRFLLNQRYRGGWLGVLDASTIRAHPDCLPE